jgi:hypothetical protein
MASIDIDIEDYLDEVSTTSLISELQSRRLHKDHIVMLRDTISKSGVLEKLDSLKSLSLSDSIRLEEFLETFNK